MEYSKGRHDVITKTLKWLDNNFCEWKNKPKRVEGFFDTLEEMKEDFKRYVEELRTITKTTKTHD